jgi:hypothetical protein
LKKEFSAFLMAMVLVLASLGFSSSVSASVAKGAPYYTMQGTHFYKDARGLKTLQIIPTNTKIYLKHKSVTGFYPIIYKKTSGYVNVATLSKTRNASYQKFERTWYSGDKTISIATHVPVVTKEGKTKKINMISYSDGDAAIAYVSAKQTKIKGNELMIKNASLIGDGNYDYGKINQVLALKKGGKKLSVSMSQNNMIHDFHGAFHK